MLAINPPTQAVSQGDNAGNRWTRGKKRAGRLLIVALIPMFVAIIGCEEPRVPVFPVSGKVTFKGQPATGAKVALHPVTGGIEGIAPYGRVGDDGTFTITVYEPGDGAPEGDYVATVQWFKQVGESAGPNVIPKQYSSPATSPVKVSVKGGPTEIPPIAIK